jgi:hypothetical protein
MDDRLRRIADEWADTLDRLNIAFGAPPFALPSKTYAWWLSRSKQLMLIADDLTRRTLGIADRLDGRVGQHLDGAHVDELCDDVRVIIGMSSGRFFGLRGGSTAVHSSLALYCCRACLGGWFLTTWGGWMCRCCSFYDGNNGILDSFENAIRLPARWRHAG